MKVTAAPNMIRPQAGSYNEAPVGARLRANSVKNGE